MTGIWAKDIKRQSAGEKIPLANKHRKKTASCVVKEIKCEIIIEDILPTNWERV